MKTCNRKASSVSSAVLIIGLVVLVFVCLNWIRFEQITGSIQPGGSSTYEIKAYSSRTVITITSTNGNMNVRIVVDGQTIIAQKNLPYFDFETKISFGLHAVQVVVENPAAIASSAPILVTGQLSCSLI